MATEGMRLGDYDVHLLPQLAGEAVRVMRAFGFAGAHVVIIGGLVPSLLVPLPDPGLEPHVGTRDIDLCLSVALVEGDVGEYERLEKSLRSAGFDMALGDDKKPQSWRWRNTSGVPVTIEFFCPTGEDRTEPGRLYRPGGIVGGKLSALVLEAGRLIDRDVRDISVEVDLPDGGGRTRHTLKVVGPAAYLASKTDALRRRNKNKDAYDVIWLLECWPGGQTALALVVFESSVYADLGPTLAALREEFATIDAAGSVKFGRFMATEAAEVDRASRRAVGAMAALVDALALLEGATRA